MAPLLEAAGRYVADFQDKFRNIVAEETYRQWTIDDVMTLRSDIVFVTLPGDVPWVTFRDINVPTLALVMLHPRHQGRLRWERKGTREFSGRTGVELRAVEVARPTLVRDLDGSDVPTEARFWIEAATGRVLRTEAQYRVASRGGRPWARSWVNTQNRPEPSLALWVPEMMYERYEHAFRGPAEARARYANHRRFRVETSEERARLAGEAPPPSVE